MVGQSRKDLTNGTKSVLTFARLFADDVQITFQIAQRENNISDFVVFCFIIYGQAIR